MGGGVISTKGETEAHARLKRLAFVWAQAQGFSACAMEVSLPKCRYRADLAACRWQRKQIGSTAVFECKQALCDLRRDNCHREAASRRLDAICKRRRVLETCLREHYPNLRNGDSLIVSRTGDPGGVGRARGIRWRPHTCAQTNLVRNDRGRSYLVFAANRGRRNARDQSTVKNNIRRRYCLALSSFLIVGDVA